MFVRTALPQLQVGEAGLFRRQYQLRGSSEAAEPQSKGTVAADLDLDSGSKAVIVAWEIVERVFAEMDPTVLLEFAHGRHPGYLACHCSAWLGL